MQFKYTIKYSKSNNRIFIKYMLLYLKTGGNMKIIVNNYVYVQKKDILYLIENHIPMPLDIMIYISDELGRINKDNLEEFYGFSSQECINFFKKLHWIVDYEALYKFKDEDIIRYVNTITDYYNELVDEYNSFTEKEKEEKSEIADQCDILLYKIGSLNDLLLFRQGDLKISLPDGIDYPDMIADENNSTKDNKVKKAVGFLMNKLTK